MAEHKSIYQRAMEDIWAQEDALVIESINEALERLRAKPVEGIDAGAADKEYGALTKAALDICEDENE